MQNTDTKKAPEESLKEKITSKRLLLSVVAIGLLTWLYLRLDAGYDTLGISEEFSDRVRLIQEKTSLFDKYIWAAVAITIGFVTGDVIGKFSGSRTREREL